MHILLQLGGRHKGRGELGGLEGLYSINDLISPIIIIFFTIVVLIVAATKYGNNKVLYRHFLACYFLKVLGCLFFVAIYTFYYNGGDTSRYFRNAKPIISMASYNPPTFLEVMTKSNIPQIETTYPIFRENFKLGHVFNMQRGKSTFIVVRLATLFGLMTFGSFLSISLCFAFFSSFGVWALYRAFTRLLPGHENAISIPVIYFPTVWFWGSSMMKDSVVICFLGFLTYCIYSIFIRKRRIFLSAIILSISIYFLLICKEYVLISYVPALLLWVILSISNNLPRFFQIALRPFLLVIALLAVFVIGPKLGEVSEKYAFDQVLATAEETGKYISRVSAAQDGSGYSLGEVSYTPVGMVSLFPRAVAVTLYQPFIFQAKNPVMLVSAFESTAVLLFTIFVIFRIGPLRFIQTLSRNPFVLAALVFSVFFAFAIGASTFNFGSLARYKLPCIPFYGLAIIYPYSLYRKNRKSLQKQSLQLELADFQLGNLFPDKDSSNSISFA